MNAVLNKIPALVEEELAASNAIHPPFHSPHEGYAVLLEEVEEAKRELEAVIERSVFLWQTVKENNSNTARYCTKHLYKDAIRLAAEAIQVAAMAKKFQAIPTEAWEV